MQETGKHPWWRPLLFKTKEELETKIQEYFRSCWDYKRDLFWWRIVDKEWTWEKEWKDWKIINQWKHWEYVLERIKPYTVSWLAAFLWTSRETLMNYEEKEEFFDTIKRAKEEIYAFTEESLFWKWATWAIFSLKNNYWWVDKQEIDNNIKWELKVNSVKQMSDEELLNMVK